MHNLNLIVKKHKTDVKYLIISMVTNVKDKERLKDYHKLRKTKDIQGT